MLRIIFPTILVATAIAIFYYFTNPAYQDIKMLQTEKASYNDALDNSKKLQQVRDQLLERFNSFPVTSVEQLEHMVPDNIDNVRLVLEIDRVASKYGMAIKNIRLDNDADRDKEKDLIATNDKPYGVVELSFSLDGPYSNFISFIGDLEKNLRIVDIVNVTFSAGDDRSVSQYNMKLRTYWLR